MAGDKNKLTEKQRQILEYLKQEILQRGFPPSVREICEAVSLRSTSSVHAHLETLERKGYIKRDATKPRAIEICDEGFHTGRLGAIQGIASEDTASQSEVAQIPLIGKVAAGEPILAVENIEGYFPMPVDRLEARLRKLAHFVEFAVLAMIIVNTFISWRVSNRVASGYILFLGLAVAVADEYIQLSVPGRTAQVTDIVLDFCGVFIIWLCREIWLWSKK